MIGYAIFQLDDLIKQLGEDMVKDILSSFSCNLNRDVEKFLSEKAMLFSRQSLSKTHLVFTSKNDRRVLIGYFTLAQKTINITRSALSRTLKDRLKKFCQFDPVIKEYILPTPLIGQIGKNYTDGNNELISGDELLTMALERIKIVQSIAGGKYAYLECEDNPYLLEFYGRNGFVNLGKRKLDWDESEFSGTYLVQMLKYFNG